ncbi:LptF/LptG family permease [Fusobacterium sp.]|uniref:LptF/LptG family permease n=1 Tax=Fusobacterium sp. TaxID=68766 RepID=UPI002617CEC4|nr:LptF/LptG family permease [Fusobacterium sp.]
MKIINRYILSEAKLPIAFGISLFTFIFMIEIIVSMMESIIIKGISLIDVIRMLSFYLPMILSQTIPMGMFLGIMITFGKFTKSSESTAMNSIGMSLKDMIKPVALMGIGVTIFIFFLQESIIPRSFNKLQQLTLKMAYENPVFQLRDKVLIDDMSDYKLYIDKIDPKTKNAKNLLIFIEEEDTKYPTLVLGETAHWKDAAMVIDDVKFYRFDKNGEENLRGTFDERKIPLSSYFQNVEMQVDDIEGMGISQLVKEMKTKKDKSEKLPYIVEINKKLAIPLSTIMLSILGVLMSIGHHRSGKGVNYGFGIGIIFVYIVFLNIGMVMSYRGKVSPYLGIWLPNILLYLFTIIMYKKKVELV